MLLYDEEAREIPLPLPVTLLPLILELIIELFDEEEK
jgi:hypothetical protein